VTGPTSATTAAPPTLPISATTAAPPTNATTGQTGGDPAIGSNHDQLHARHGTGRRHVPRLRGGPRQHRQSQRLER
jgi:hypothetical protein